jgi:hypothetical protein
MATVSIKLVENISDPSKNFGCRVKSRFIAFIQHPCLGKRLATEYCHTCGLVMLLIKLDLARASGCGGSANGGLSANIWAAASAIISAAV